jgi:CheY-like chemotaxis protein
MSPPSSIDPGLASLQTRVVMVVDDNATVRRTMEGLLHTLGFLKVMIAEDGIKALTLLDDPTLQPDIILCDWRIPHMDGLQLLNRIRDEKRAVKFVMVTALNTIEAAMLAKTHGADGFLIKPATKDGLEKAITDAFAHE